MLKSWALVEGTLADKYGLSLQDIMNMSWRRFVVLYKYLFTSGALTRVESDDTAPTPTTLPALKGGMSYDKVDWNKLTNTAPADQVRERTFSEYMDGSGLTRKVVD